MQAARFVTVVSGVPRSGTSLMMQMLVAGGLPAFTDGRRVPDSHNPRGYWEHEAVKRTADDPSWVAAARGCAVKVVHALVPALPPHHPCRVILMRRRLDEVLASQRAMLGDACASALPDARMAEIFEAQLGLLCEWARERRVPLLEVDHARLFAAPSATATDVAAFLALGLDVPAMAAQLDPALHRQLGGPASAL